MAYGYLNIAPPGRGKLNRAASSVLNPLSRQMAAPAPTPDYGQQISSFMGAPQMAAPNFAAGTPNAASTAPFSFANEGNPAFSGAGLDAPKPAGPLSFAGQSIDYASDPILQQVQAAVQAQIAQAQAAAIGAEKTNLIRYGSPELVKSVLGAEADQATIDAARNNSFGTVQELGRWNDRALSGIDSATNRNNLYFSSTRSRDRGLQAEDYTRRQASTANQLQDVLTGIAQGLLGTRQAGQQQLVSAMADAYNRALQQAMYLASLANAGAGAGGTGTGTGTGGASALAGGGIAGITPGTSSTVGSAGGVVTPPVGSALPGLAGGELVPWWQSKPWWS